MPNTIKIKRKPQANGAGVPNSLVAGELAFSEADAKLFYGLDTAGSVSPIEIAGSGYVLSKIAENAPTKTGGGANGTWNINVTGNAGSVTNGIYTTGNQTINGVKTFTSGTQFDKSITIGDLNNYGKLDIISADQGYLARFGDGGSNIALNGTIRVQTLAGGDQLVITPNGYGGSRSAITSGVWRGDAILVDKGGTGATSLTANNILVGNGTSAISAPYSVETTLTGGSSAIPRADAVKTYVDSLLSANDAMVFKGTLGTGGTVTALPTGTVSAGWTYRVITAGTYAGVVCEIGDMIIAVAEPSGNVNSTWTVIQTNIDGAVVGPASSTNNNFALFNGATGKLIADAGFGSGAFYSSSNPNGYTSNVGTVTSVGGAGSVAGLTLTGSVTTTGNLTLGGTLSTPVSTINDSTTVGQNLVKLTNPSAIRFLRINANNTVDTLTDSDFRTAIGAGTSSTVGTVTSITAGSGMNFTSISSSGLVTLGTPSNVTLATTNSLTANSHTHAFAPGGTTAQYIRGDGTLATTPVVNDATLTLNVSGTGLSGSQTFTANQSLAATFTVTSNATPANTASTIVARDASNSFSAGTITATLNGNASTVTSGVYTSGSYADPSWITSLAKSKVGLGNVENTALSTWAGSTNITTLGTITTGSWGATTIAVDKGGTGQTSYTNGQLLIGNTTGNTLTKATLTQGTGIVVTNGAGSITVAHNDTSSLNGLTGGNGISSITVDDFGHVTAIGTATYLTSGTVCSAIADCTIDGGTF